MRDLLVALSLCLMALAKGKMVSKAEALNTARKEEGIIKVAGGQLPNVIGAGVTLFCLFSGSGIFYSLFLGFLGYMLGIVLTAKASVQEVEEYRDVGVQVDKGQIWIDAPRRK